MRAREYFEAVRAIEREMRRRIWAVESAEEVLKRMPGGTAREMSHAKGSYYASRLEDKLLVYSEAVEAYARSVDDLVNAEHEAHAYIREIGGTPGGDNYRDVLQLRYVCLLDDAEICRRMCCAKSTLRRWVSEAFAWYDELQFFDRNPPRWI